MLSGRGSYLASVAVNFLFHKIGRRWRVTLDDEVIEDTFALVSMCNGRYYGGGSTPVPEARMTDGVLHTVLVKNVSKARFATLFGGYSATTKSCRRTSSASRQRRSCASRRLRATSRPVLTARACTPSA